MTARAARATPRPAAGFDAELAGSGMTKLDQMRRHLSARLVERDEEIDATLLGLVSGYSVLLVGPPGVAKSLLLAGVGRWFGGRSFGYQLTKFTTPDELFGGYDLAALRKGQSRLAREGMILDAEFVFLDEIFNAGSALLNSLLGYLNEGVYRFCGETHEAGRLLVVAASNRYPGGPDAEEAENSAALYDRFMIRLDVRVRHSREGWRRLMDADPAEFDCGPPPGAALLSRAELEQVRQLARRVPVAPEARDAWHAIREELDRPGERRVAVSPRRVVQAGRVFRAAAVLDLADRVEPRHLLCLKHVLWGDAGEERARVAEVVGRLADPAGEQLRADLAAAQEIYEQAVEGRGTAGAFAERMGKLSATRDAVEARRGKHPAHAEAYDRALRQLDAWYTDLARQMAERTRPRR